MDISPYLPPSNSLHRRSGIGCRLRGLWELATDTNKPGEGEIPAGMGHSRNEKICIAVGGFAARPSPRCRAILAELAAILPRMASVSGCRPTRSLSRVRMELRRTNGRADSRAVLVRQRGERFVPISKQGSIYRQSRSSCLPEPAESSGETGKPLEFAQARKKARRNDVDIRLLTTAVQHFSEDRVVVHTS